MMKTISAADYQERFLREVTQQISNLVWREDGAIYPEHIYQNMIGPDAACDLAYRCAIAYHMTRDITYAEYGKKALNYAERSLICTDGVYYWSYPIPSLCSMGRWMRDAIYAAELLDDMKAFAWLDKMLSAWPYDPVHHCFVERFTAGTHYPTCVNGFLTTFNMVCEGSADAWMVAKKTGNAGLLEKARDTLCNFILPGQREDGIWNYHAKRDVDTGLLNDGETEFNYNLYLLSILSNFLLDEEGRTLVLVPLERSFRELQRRFHFSDGSTYTPVHWGWDHIFESTLLCCEISWRLYHWCSMPEYESLCARGLHWLSVADLGVGNLCGNMSCVGLCWNTHFMTILADDFSVSSDVATVSEIISTLQMVEKKLSVIPSDCVHSKLYFTLLCYETHQALQRKITRLQHHISKIHVPFGAAQNTYEMPWNYMQTGYAATASLHYDEEALYLTVQTNCQEAFQPYSQASLFYGDSILLDFDTGAQKCRISLAVENGKPVLYHYNSKIPFAADLRLYEESEPRGWYLKDSTLQCRQEPDGLYYCAKILWSELGVHPEVGMHWQGGLSVNRYTRCGVQFNQLGRTVMETQDPSYTGHFIFD